MFQDANEKAFSIVVYALTFITIFSLFGFLIFESVKIIQADNFAKWEHCIKSSDYTDAACEECDAKYNKVGNFKLD